MQNSNIETMPISELEEFYYHTCEDFHLWDETEKGPYPVQRILDAIGLFLKSKKEKLKVSYDNGKTTNTSRFYPSDEIKR
jgi:hypothetical protein